MKKGILAFLLGGIVFSSITVFAYHVYQPNEISYSPKNSSFKVSNIKDGVDTIKREYTNYRSDSLQILLNNNIVDNNNPTYDQISAGLKAAAGRGSVYYLGTGTSFDIKTLFPSYYNILTKDNFLVVPTGSQTGSFSQSSSCDHHFTNASYTVNANTSVSYNSETGALSITGSTWSQHTDKWGNQFVRNYSGYCNFSYKVYLIIGTMKTV